MFSWAVFVPLNPILTLMGGLGGVVWAGSLEQAPPIPTLQDGSHPLHRFLGFDKDRHIASLCLRDPLDIREMPPNGNAYVSANCVRGVKKVCFHP